MKATTQTVGTTAEIVSVQGGKFHRPENTLFNGGGNDIRNARLMRCGRSLVPLNFFETVADADRYTGGRLQTYICQQCEKKVSFLWRVDEVLKNGIPTAAPPVAEQERVGEVMAEHNLSDEQWDALPEQVKAAMTTDGNDAEQEQATARPWIVDEVSDGVCYIVAKDIALIATLDPSDDDAPARANAELIVRAVNAYDDLVAALRAVEEGWSTQPGHKVLAKVRAALESIEKGR